MEQVFEEIEEMLRVRSMRRHYMELIQQREQEIAVLKNKLALLDEIEKEARKEFNKNKL